MPAAARLGDNGSGHGCFPATPIIAGSGDVSINGKPAARKGDAILLHACPCPQLPHGIHGRSISAGSANVSINGKPAARVGDAIDCGGSVAAGSGNVFIGDTPYKSPTHDCGEGAALKQSPFLRIQPLAEAPPFDWASLPFVEETHSRAAKQKDKVVELEDNSNSASYKARVKSPGNQADAFQSFDATEKIPPLYRNDARFESLASDPAHAGKVSVGSRREAMAGLEAEALGIMKAKIQRGPAEIEFFDATGSPFDVKTPPSAPIGQRDFFNVRKTGKSLLKQVDKEFPNNVTGKSEKIKVILDSTYLNSQNHKALWKYLNDNATPDQLSRILELNVKL